MKLNTKIIGLVITSFLIISGVFMVVSIQSLKNNQTDNIESFRNEFSEMSLELLQNNAKLFFYHIDKDIERSEIKEKKDILNLIEELDPEKVNVVLVDTNTGKFEKGYGEKETIELLSEKIVDGFLDEWILNQKTDFEFDNYEDFKNGIPSTTPYKINFKIYEDYNLMIGYGRAFETGKIRIDFINKKNEEFFRINLIRSIAIFLCGAILIPFILILLISKLITIPVRKISKGFDKIRKGDFDTTIDFHSRDEIGNLAESFNITTNELKKSRKKLEDYSKRLKKENVKNLEREKAKLEALLGNLGEGVIATDLEGKIMILNKQAEKMFGKKFKECYGKPYMKLFDFRNEKGEKGMLTNGPTNKITHKKKTKKTLKQNPISTRGYYIRKGQSPLPVAITLSPIISENKLTGIVSTFRDITLEEKIDQAKTEFVSLASHQLQTPLTAIRWFLEILLNKEKLTEKQREYVKNAMISNQRMINLVEDFLNVSRLEAGSISVYSKEGDFVEFIEGIIREAKVIAIKKKQKIIFNTSSKKILGEFDSNLISQIISNLISNAMHYSDKGSIIRVSIEKAEEHIQIKVADKGIGISEEDQKKLFTKFFRTKKSSQVSTSGSGLGLYIVKKILDAYKGSIQCESNQGKGTVFSILLPINGPVIKGKRELLEGRIS